MRVEQVGTTNNYGVLSTIFTTKAELSTAKSHYGSGYTIIVVDEDNFEDLYPVGSIYINARSETNPATLLGFGTWTRLENVFLYCVKSGYNKTGGASTVTLKTANLPKHSHDYTPEGSISEVDLAHVHNIKHTHTTEKHKHTAENHKHTVTAQGEIKTNCAGKTGFVTTKLAAYCTPVFSAVDEKVLQLEDFESRCYSTGEQNKWNTNRGQQKLVLNLEELAKQLDLQFEGKEVDTSEVEVTINEAEVTVNEFTSDSDKMSANEKHKHTFTGTKKATTDVGSTESFSILPSYLTVAA